MYARLGPSGSSQKPKSRRGRSFASPAPYGPLFSFPLRFVFGFRGFVFSFPAATFSKAWGSPSWFFGGRSVCCVRPREPGATCPQFSDVRSSVFFSLAFLFVGGGEEAVFGVPPPPPAKPKDFFLFCFFLAECLRVPFLGIIFFLNVFGEREAVALDGFIFLSPLPRGDSLVHFGFTVAEEAAALDHFRNFRRHHALPGGIFVLDSS